MSDKKTVVFGLYPTVARAEGAVDELVSARFPNADISVLMADNQGSKDFAHEKQTKAPEGTTTGAATGGAVGGTLGLLAGIGALAIPGVGPFIAAGPIMGALAGLGVGGTVGGLIGALVGMGIPEYEAKRYEGRLKQGGVLLSVHCDTSEQITRAKEILKRTGADESRRPARKRSVRRPARSVAPTRSRSTYPLLQYCRRRAHVAALRRLRALAPVRSIVRARGTSLIVHHHGGRPRGRLLVRAFPHAKQEGLNALPMAQFALAIFVESGSVAISF